MGDTFERSYIPQVNNTKPQITIHAVNEFRNQSHSRDKHNKRRAANHRFKKKLENLNCVYNNKPLFIFKLLDDDIRIIDKNLKKTLNNLLENYEKKTACIDKCHTPESLDLLCNKLNKMCETIEYHINKNNFVEYIAKGYFINKDDINLRDVPEYSALVSISIDGSEQHMENKITMSGGLKENISFADMLRKNIS